MMLAFISLAILASTAAAARRFSNGSACAVVSSSSAVLVAASPSATPTVDAQLAYDCLNSVPLGLDAAIALVEDILPFVEWQTDLAYLKNPPSSYLEPAVDIRAELDLVLTNLRSGVYSNEYQFQADLFRTFNLAHDGHFRFFPDALTGALSFARPVGLVSVSLDGVEVPKVYAYSDIVAYNANLTTAPSALSKIYGEDAVPFLENLSQLGATQDPDAAWNTMMYELGFAAETNGWNGYFAGSGRFGYIYTNASTTIEFENGTITTYQNFAKVIGDFTGVTDGESFYQKFCTGPTPTPASNTTVPTSTSSPTSGPTVTANNYPEPIVISADKQVSGYFLDGSAYEDVAVLSMISFEPTVPVEFQSVVQNLIADAKATGKTKLVIDLSANGGGLILQGYDTFRQLFPQITQDGFTRFREHEAFTIMSEQISALTANFSAATASDDEIFIYESPLNYRFNLNLTDGRYTSYDADYAPHVYDGDNFTNIIRWNLNDPLTTINATWGMGEYITGYGPRQNFTQPFAAEDIIMVYDGYCASTCTLFSEFMRIQAGVQSIMFGGRPSTNAIQAIGGVKGSNNWPYSYITELAGVVLENGTPSQVASWDAVRALSTLPQNRSTDNSVNVRDNILRYNLEDGLPAQFVYEAADCRLFYTPEMITDVTALWKAAADAAWGGAGCVVGSLQGGNETMVERRRKSDAIRMRAKSERRLVPKSLDVDWNEGSKSKLGRKVPS